MNILDRVAQVYSRDAEFCPHELAKAIGSNVTTARNYRSFLYRNGGEVEVAREAINEKSRLSKPRNR